MAGFEKQGAKVAGIRTQRYGAELLVVMPMKTPDAPRLHACASWAAKATLVSRIDIIGPAAANAESDSRSEKVIEPHRHSSRRAATYAPGACCPFTCHAGAQES